MIRNIMVASVWICVAVIFQNTVSVVQGQTSSTPIADQPTTANPTTVTATPSTTNETTTAAETTTATTNTTNATSEAPISTSTAVITTGNSTAASSTITTSAAVTTTPPTVDLCGTFKIKSECCSNKQNVTCYFCQGTQNVTSGSQIVTVCRTECNVTDEKDTCDAPPSPVTTAATTVTTVVTSTVTSTVTEKREEKSGGQHFDGASFIGGIVLCAGLIAIGFFGLKFYKARKEQTYHTL